MDFVAFEKSSNTALAATAAENYENWVRPLIGRLLALLKMDVSYTKAEGENLFYTANGTEICVKDFLGGYGTTLLGHNFPPAVEALKSALLQKIPFQSQASIKEKCAELAQLLNFILKVERLENGLEINLDYICTFTNSGAESSEAAMKLALMSWQQKKARWLHQGLVKGRREDVGDMRDIQPLFVSLKRSFHGKTSGAVTLTSNPDFSNMFEQKAVKVIFIDPDAENFEEEIEKHCPEVKFIQEKYGFHPLAGFFYEPLQAEGGIHGLSEKFLQSAQEFAHKYHFPLIADEIQSGWMRCGAFSLSHKMGIVPDILLLGKALGGGLVKTGAMLAKEKMYVSEFGLKHTSTFGEDELSAAVTLEVARWMYEHQQQLQSIAEKFEFEVKKNLLSLQNQFPGVIASVRGRGLLMGFELESESEKLPFFVKALFDSGFGSYFMASYLLNQHDVRVGVTLSSPMTLRLEPCAFYSDEALGQLFEGLRKLVECLFQNHIGELTKHLWKETQLPVRLVSPAATIVKSSTPLTKVAFLGHLIDHWQGRYVDPILKHLSERDLDKVIEVSKYIDLDGIIEQTLLKDKIENKIHFHMYGFFNTSQYFEKELRSGRPDLLRRLQKVISHLENQGIEYIGLGQYTSIVGLNGLGLKTNPRTKLTTGNSLTAAMALAAVEKTVKERGWSVKDLKVGVVGVTGNICQVLAECLADQVRELFVFYKEQVHISPKFQQSIQKILSNSDIDPSRLKAFNNMDELIHCDLILVGTNSPIPVIKSEHLKKDAIVVDISIPANVHPDVRMNRSDVVCFSGGLVKLPFAQEAIPIMSPLPKGETFACLAETMMMGLLNVQQPYSYGALTKESVQRAWEDSKKVGYELGSYHYVGAFK